MSYEYKDHEIFARVWQSGSALYHINYEGEITEEVPNCDIVHDDQEIVWYEFDAINPKIGHTMTYIEVKTLEEAKKIIDKSVKYMERFND